MSEHIITFSEESYESLVDEMKPLVDLHWEEIALHKDKIKLSPDFDLYELLSNNGILRIFTARDNGELVGYFVVFVDYHPHYKDHKFATNDIIYLKKDLRSAGVGKELISFAEEVLKEAGVSVIIMNMKTHQPFGKLMEHIGYTNSELIYSKYIGD